MFFKLKPRQTDSTKSPFYDNVDVNCIHYWLDMGGLPLSMLNFLSIFYWKQMQINHNTNYLGRNFYDVILICHIFQNKISSKMAYTTSRYYALEKKLFVPIKILICFLPNRRLKSDDIVNPIVLSDPGHFWNIQGEVCFVIRY